MGITSFTVGGKFESEISYTSHTFEINYQLDDGENLKEAVSECKLLIADIVSGGESVPYLRALRVMAAPTVGEKIDEATKKLEEREEKLQSIRDRVKSAKEELKELTETEEGLIKLERLLEVSKASTHFWEMVQKVAETDVKLLSIEEKPTETTDSEDIEELNPF